MAKERFRFYRSNLATIVWNPKRGCPLAEFVKGEFITEDPDVAQQLIDYGYPRVALDATDPPDILFKKGEILTGNVKIMPAQVTEQSTLNKEKVKVAVGQSVTKSPADATLAALEGADKAKKPKPKAKAKAIKKATAKASGRRLKRRTKKE